MINYTEKGYGLHEAIRAAGHWLRDESGVWASSDDVAVQIIIDSYTLDAAKAEKSAQVSAFAKTLRDKAIGTISAGEMASWPIKLSEAAKFAIAGDASQCPMLSAEAAARGVTVAALVAKVGNNAQIFSALEAGIAGADGKHRDEISLLMTFDAVTTYDFSTGWPAV